MRPFSAIRASLIAAVVVTSSAQWCSTISAADTSATRPYFLLFAASLDRVIGDFEVVFESAGRGDLSKSLEGRLTTFRNFAGIDRTKPIGMMTTWNDDERAEVVFLPVGEIDDLLKTVTFGIVGYHQVTPDRFEIERPGSPYHALIRKDYALFADSISTIQSLRVTPEQLTRGLRDRFEVVLFLDLKQVPLPARAGFVKSIREQAEPWLQPQDDEPTESANLRRTIGNLALNLIQRATLDTSTVTVGVHIDPKTRTFSAEAVIEASPNSPMATSLNRWTLHRSEFSSLVSPDVPAGLAINVPLDGFVEQIIGTSSDRPKKGAHLDAGLQLVGSGLGNLSLIAALSGDDAKALNAAIPELIIKLEKSGLFLNVSENFDVHREVVLHSVTPREIPSSIATLVGAEPEIMIGQGKRTVWVGIGQPDTLLERLHDAIEQVDDSSSDRVSAPLVRARFQAKQLPELVTSDLLIPNVDAESSRAAFAKGEDGFSLTIEPVNNGIRLKIEAEEGFLRLIGRDWVNQIEKQIP